MSHNPATEPPASPEAATPKLTTLLLLALAAVTLFFVGVFASGPIRGFVGSLHSGDSEDGGEHDHNGDQNGETQWYISGMHPWIIQPEPGYCPVCGMELTPLSPDMLTGELSIDPLIVQNIGVRTAEVTRGQLVSAIHAFGTIEFDETARREVVLRAPGYLEHLNLRYEGQRVEQGAVIAEVHSPAILAALNELRALRRSGTDTSEVRATRQRLRVLGLQAEQIEALETAEASPWTVELRSPVSGVITRLSAREGSWLDEGAPLVEITPLDQVWAMATIYESQLPRIKESATVTARLTQLSGQTLEGTVDYIYPTLNPATRQGRARLVFANPNGELKPGMFLRLEIDASSSDDVLQIPREAVLDTGQRQITYISLGDGRFEPREVRVGRETERGKVEILDGLQVGERVVVSGQFLLDSEARLRESLLKLVLGESASEQVVQAPVDTESKFETLPEDFASALSKIIDAYLDAAAPLIDDHVDGIASAAEALGEAAEEAAGAAEALPAEHREELITKSKAVAEAARRLATTSSPQTGRLALNEVSEPLRDILRITGIPAEYPEAIHEVRCPMFPEVGQNAWWLQRATPTANPYMGQAMLTCHDRRFALPRAGERSEDAAEDSGDDHDDHVPTETTKDDNHHTARGEITQFEQMDLGSDASGALSEAIKAYLALGEHLVRDSLDNAESKGSQLHNQLSALPQMDRAQSAAEHLAEASDLDTVRMAYAVIGEELIGFLHAAGLPPSHDPDDLIAARCHMYPDFGSYGWWFQREGDLKNPLWGPAMLACADIVRPLMERDADEADTDHGNANGGHDHD